MQQTWIGIIIILKRNKQSPPEGLEKHGKFTYTAPRMSIDINSF